MGEHTRRNKTTNETPSKPTKIPKRDSPQKRRDALNINALAPRFSQYGMAVIRTYECYMILAFNRSSRRSVGVNGLVAALT